MKIYNIPAIYPFAESLAQGLLAMTGGRAELLGTYRLLLPTRRATRVVRDAFLKLAGNTPLLLPRLQALGDVDDEEMTLLSAHLELDTVDIKPAMPTLQRQILLSRLVLAQPDYAHGADHALKLARALGALLDQLHINDLPFAALEQIVPADFSEHWQITLQFLNIISQHWPTILEEYGMMDASARRQKLLYELADFWEKSPPAGPVIAAGSTGSQLATSNLLKVVANMPEGTLVLPGLDSAIDDDVWEAIDLTHPQYMLKNLLEKCGVHRSAVETWPHLDGLQPWQQQRADFARTLMLPSIHTSQWAQQKNEIEKLATANARHLTVHECKTTQAEAEFISVLLRETLEPPDKTCAVICPDRTLATLIRATCTRWNIEIDDSGGIPMTQHPLGRFFLSLPYLISRNFAPVALLDFCKSRYCKIKLPENFEVKYLRGVRNLAGLSHYEKDEPDFVKTLTLVFAPLLALAEKDHQLGDFLQAHMQVLENIEGTTDIWSSEAGEALATFLAQLHYQSANLQHAISLGDYCAILTTLFADVAIRVTSGVIPRVTLLGRLEARMVQADRVIIAGLNEGSFPPDVGQDPWMSRPMRKNAGLPALEQGIGLSAHDFVQAFSAHDVILTRAVKSGGTVAVPSRWWVRLQTLLEAVGQKFPRQHAEIINFAERLDRTDETIAIDRPIVKPPLAARPSELPVTDIENWMRDPYIIYAKRILKLKKLDDLEPSLEASDIGSFVHEQLKSLLPQYPGPWNDKTISAIKQAAHIAAQELLKDDTERLALWLPQFMNTLEEFLTWERDRRAGGTFPAALEVKGQTKIEAPAFTLTARADRIDKNGTGTYEILDYKTGEPPTKKKVTAGISSQIMLESNILERGGFEKIAGDVNDALYLKIGGTFRAVSFAKELTACKETAWDGFVNLVTTFANDDTPYICQPDPLIAPKYNDYHHLARVDEWGVAGEGDQGGDE
ncbi:MAG: hypothetical protein GC136_07935 [Alphaproteobacteria bacterium]|nr:hypothetical protein [Alphaproteobacteria bacterium]